MAPKIQLDPEILSSQGDRMDSLKRDFDELFRDVSGTLYDTNYNWSEYLANNFSWKINSAQKSFSAVTSMLESGAEAARNSAATFSSLDDSLAKLFGQGPGADAASGASAAARAGMASMTGGSTAFDFQQGQNGGLISPDQIDDLQDKTFDVLKDISKLIKEAGKKEAGIFKDGLSYMEDLVNFYLGDKSGLSGTKDWLDLADSTLGLWKGMYDYLYKAYKGFGGFFSESANKKVKGIGVASDVFGLFGDVTGAFDNIINNYDPNAPVYSNVLMGIGELIGTADSFGDLLAGIAKFYAPEALYSGVTNPLMIYLSIYSGIVESNAQFFKSLGKYSKDGHLSVEDWAKTGIEVSVHGFGGIFDKLFYGLADDAISAATFGLISPDDLTADKISERIENFGSDLGENIAGLYDDKILWELSSTKAGEYINNHPDLYKKFYSSGRVAQLYIADYAAFMGLFE